MHRKEFLITSCKAVFMLTAGTVLFNECKTTAIHETENEISLPTSSMKGKNNLLLTTKKMPEKILLVRQKEGGYHALEMKCTHKGAALVQKNNELVCPAHGSEFDMDGKVVQSPAARDLKKYAVTERGGEIVIHVGKL